MRYGKKSYGGRGKKRRAKKRGRGKSLRTYTMSRGGIRL